MTGGPRPERPLTLATRGSALALWQANHVAGLLAALEPFPEVLVKTVSTAGDRDQSTPLTTLGGQGVFVKDIEQRLLDGEADLAVHSLKDLPSQETPGLCIAAVLPREDARDGLVSLGGQSLLDLPPGAQVGTSSSRRVGLVRALRPDLELVPLRGNVETRLARVAAGDLEAVILAVAGLTRLELQARISQFLDPAQFVPAPGQGALAVQVRDSDSELRRAVAQLEDPGARLCVECERACLAAFGGGCEVPLGAHAHLDQGRVAIDAVAMGSSLDGRLWRESASAEPARARAVGAEMGARLLRLARG